MKYEDKERVVVFLVPETFEKVELALIKAKRKNKSLTRSQFIDQLLAEKLG